MVGDYKTFEKVVKSYNGSNININRFGYTPADMICFSTDSWAVSS